MSVWGGSAIESARRVETRTRRCWPRMPGGFAVFGDVQWLPGYCILLTNQPAVSSPSDLPHQQQVEFLTSRATLGEAVAAACSTLDPAFRRLNYDILGNTDDFLHAHVWPRYWWEPPERVSKPVWLYPGDHWTSPEYRSASRHEALREAIRSELVRRGGATR